MTLPINEEDGGVWTTASLRVFSSVLSTQEISARLGLPSLAYERGEPVSSRSTQRRAESAWILNSAEPQAKAIGAQLNWLVQFAEEHRQQIYTLQENCNVDLLCGFASDSGQASFKLEHHLIARISMLRLDVTLDLYPPETTR